MSYCLPFLETQKFLKGLKDRSIDPQKLAEMSSKERNEFFKDIVGEEHAKEVNALFESKLLLKNQQQGMVTWAKTVAGLKPEVRRDMISKIEKMQHILDVENEDAFLNDLVEQKLGIGVTFEEAQKIAEHSKAVEEAKIKQTGTPEEYLAGKETKQQKTERLAYGEEIRKMLEYVDELGKITDKNIISNIANVPKTVMSTLDFSAAMRQGWGMMSRPEWYSAFGKMFKYGFSEKAFNELQADILSRPTYELMKKGGLRISAVADKLSQREEQFMSTMLNKVPGIRGSERAYVGFLNKLRADTFDHLLKNAKTAGENISGKSQVIKDLASVVNDFTGSGNIGKGDRYANSVPLLNATFFSPRKLSGIINMLNPERYINPKISATARKAALRQLIGTVGITMTLLGLAKMGGAKVESDPRSSDFGKFVVGKTHYDLSGGNASYLTLLARIALQSTKSTVTNKINKLGIGFNKKSSGQLVLEFSRNKLSPLAGVVADAFFGPVALYGKGGGKKGDQFSASKETLGLIKPMIINDLISLMQQDKSQAIPATLLNMFGVGIGTY